jgi:hypothetical protein
MFTFNAEHFYFLHDLISSYVKEKERRKISCYDSCSMNIDCDLVHFLAHLDEKSRQTSTNTHHSSINSAQVPPLDTNDKNDHRRFHCPDTKWKLQPAIKLLTAYGKQVEPFGAEYILQKLGFHHARLTIPKWLQRGMMDPCEQTITIVQLILIYLLPERFKDECIRS